MKVSGFQVAALGSTARIFSRLAMRTGLCHEFEADHEDEFADVVELTFKGGVATVGNCRREPLLIATSLGIYERSQLRRRWHKSRTAICAFLYVRDLHV